MRLYELITEAISLTHLKNPLNEAITGAILDSTHQIYYKESQVPPEIVRQANLDSSLSEVHKITRKWLAEQLDARLPGSIEEVIERETGIETEVSFIHMSSEGRAPGIDMTLNYNYIEKLANDITEEVYQFTLDTLEREHKIVEQFFLCHKNTDNYVLFHRSNISEIVQALVSTTIHELTHNVQHSTQFKKGKIKKKGKVGTEYRSYLEKNLEKFHQMIRKSQSEGMTPEEYKIYRASPQEITPFAQEAALKFINDLDVDRLPLEDFKALRGYLPREIRYYQDNMFSSDPNNRAEFPVFKRFNKLFYQEVMRYIDRVEQQKKQQANQQK